MMLDVNILSHYYDPLAARYVDIANTYWICDEYNRVDAYSGIVFDDLLLNNKYKLKPSTKRKIAACNALTAITASPSLSQSHLVDEWVDYTNGIPQSIVIATLIDAVNQLNLPALFLASRPESPKCICTLQFSAGTKRLNTPPPDTHIDSQ